LEDITLRLPRLLALSPTLPLSQPPPQSRHAGADAVAAANARAVAQAITFASTARTVPALA
jgi:hypothetical protein